MYLNIKLNFDFNYFGGLINLSKIDTLLSAYNSIFGGGIKHRAINFILIIGCFFTFSFATYSQSWDNDCDFETCLETNNVPWRTDTVTILLNNPESPNCWVQVGYKIRENDTLCPSTECEVEIQFVVTSGECFYPYTDYNTSPPTTYPAYMDITSHLDMWTKSLEMFFESNIEPCFTPTGPGRDGCVYVPRVHSATCKKITQNPDSSVTITYCETFNSCCSLEMIICKNYSGENTAGWHLPDEVPDNCHLNNDPDCKLVCESHDWLAPKIIYYDEFKVEDISFKPIENGFEVNTGSNKVSFEIVNILGNSIKSGNIEGYNIINISDLSTGFYILNLNYNGLIKTVKFVKQ